MEQIKSKSRFHKEYSCIPEIVRNEQVFINKRISRNKWIWIMYGAVLGVSIWVLPMWMTALLCLSGIVSFPTIFNSKDLMYEKPFLVVNVKYIQFKGKLISWDSVQKIVITDNKNKRYDKYTNFTMTFTYQKGRQAYVDTCYFEEQQEIVDSIIELSNSKKIPIEVIQNQ